MKNYKKGFVIPLVIAIIALLGIGGGAYYYKVIYKTGCEKVNVGTSRDACYLLEAKNSNKPASCEKIKIQSTKADCYVAMADINKDVNFCEKIYAQDGVITDKKDECFGKMAKTLLSVDLCDKLSNSLGKSDCYNLMSNLLENPAVCSKLFNSEQIQSCKSVQMSNAAKDKNLSICGKFLDNLDKDYCLIQVAITNHDYSICQSVQDIKYKASCELKRYPSR
jgi:hypothetical protein